jgi:hypothetical protein
MPKPRPAVDLASLTSEAAVPMPEATPRMASVPTPAPVTAPPPRPAALDERQPEHTKTADLEAISFKVPPAFRRRFRQRAVNADMKLNELLFAALEAWEEKHNLKG